MNFVEKVMAYVQGGDEAKVLKFKTDVEKFLKRQIKEVEAETEELEDKLQDRKDELQEAVVNIDLGRIKTSEHRKHYVGEYIDTLECKEALIVTLTKKIESNGKLIELRKSQLNLLK